MDGLPTHLPKDPEALIALLKKQQREIDSLQYTLTRKDKTLAKSDKALLKQDDTIRELEERLRALLKQRFGKALRSSTPISISCLTEQSY